VQPKVWFIHGAGSSPLSFNWLKARLHAPEVVDIAYDNQTPLIDTIRAVRTAVKKEEIPPFIIGHSLGGVIAASVAQRAPVAKIVTMATPFGGSFAATIMRWFMPTQLMRDISQQSPVLKSLQDNPPTVPMLSFVTDSNLTIMGERTDGVVTVNSQTALKGPTYVNIPVNHFEVLLAPEVVEQINVFLFGAQE
jgi:pimeloyl-ACP methyl ester carboxylesterase